MVSYVKIFNLLKDNNEFSFIKNLKLEEAHKLLDFQKVFNQNINPNNDQEIKAVSYLLFFTVAKTYYFTTIIMTKYFTTKKAINICIDYDVRIGFKKRC